MPNISSGLYDSSENVLSVMYRIQ